MIEAILNYPEKENCKRRPPTRAGYMEKVSRATVRRLKKQRQKERIKSSPKPIITAGDYENPLEDDIEIEYVAAPVIPETDAILLDKFSNVISRFTVSTTEEDDTAPENIEFPTENGEDSFDEDDTNKKEPKLSRKKMKRLSRMSLAELKQYARNPEVVEWEDVTSPDPKLLVQLKAARHSVPVPRHWSQKRKYLSGKRGFVKPPFELPTFIKDTGITELRDTMRSQDSTKRVKVRAREKMHPKLGRISVDYERLYDAFFKYQTKPPMTVHGDLYYEGREFEGKGDKKPGFLSEELRMALGMATHLMPPPWLHSMQKYGPPPSYPHMKIPGLNAPIPDGAQWGYHPGGWGKPPVDNFMRDMPIKTDDPAQLMLLNSIERNLWGELEPDEELPVEEVIYEGPHEITLEEEDIQQYESPHRLTEYRETDEPVFVPEVAGPIEIRKERKRK